jgi:hypothetical protein
VGNGRILAHQIGQVEGGRSGDRSPGHEKGTEALQK